MLRIITKKIKKRPLSFRLGLPLAMLGTLGIAGAKYPEQTKIYVDKAQEFMSHINGQFAVQQDSDSIKKQLPYFEYFSKASMITGQPIEILYATGAKESGFNKKAKSNKGAYNVMQVTYSGYQSVKDYSLEKHGIELSWEDVKEDPWLNIYTAAVLREKDKEIFERIKEDGIGSLDKKIYIEELGYVDPIELAVTMGYYEGADNTLWAIKKYGLEKYLNRLARSGEKWKDKRRYAIDVLKGRLEYEELVKKLRMQTTFKDFIFMP